MMSSVTVNRGLLAEGQCSDCQQRVVGRGIMEKDVSDCQQRVVGRGIMQ